MARLAPEPWSPEQIDFLRRLIYMFHVLPAGYRVNSLWRDPWKNQAVGGSANSLHLDALAADIDPPTADLEKGHRLGQLANALGLSSIVYWDSGRSYVHVQARPLLGGQRLVLKTDAGSQNLA